ncbi:DUF378 domain-containing protein [bacterium]|nr:MAG: DUF378 domain-containing protein [bacterium]
MKAMHMLTWILVVIGGLNWLLVGLFKWDIGLLFGEQNNMVARVIYILVGLSAVVELIAHRKYCKFCEKGPASGTQPM